MNLYLTLPNMNNINNFQNNIQNEFTFDKVTHQVNTIVNHTSVINHENTVNDFMNNSQNNYNQSQNSSFSSNHSQNSSYSSNYSSSNTDNYSHDSSNSYENPGKCIIKLYDKDLIFKDNKTFRCNASNQKCKIEEELSKDLANDIKKVKVENCDCKVKLYQNLKDRKKEGINFFDVKSGDTVLPTKKQRYNKLYAKCFMPGEIDNKPFYDGDENQYQDIIDDWNCNNQNICKIKAKSKNFNYESNKSFRCILSNGMCLIDRKLHKSLVNDVQTLELENCDCIVKLYKDNDDQDKYSQKKNFYKISKNSLVQVNGDRYNRIMIKCQADDFPSLNRNYEINN